MRNIKALNLIYPIVILLFIFQSFFSELTIPLMQKLFGLYDEVFTIVSVVISLFIIFNNRTKKSDYRELTLLIIFQIVGIIGSLIYNIQPVNAILFDLIATSKFILVFWSTLIIFRGVSIGLLLRRLLMISKTLTIILFFSSLLSVFHVFSTLVTKEIRFGLNSFKFVFYHPSILAMAGVMILSILVLTSKDFKGNEKYILMILMPISLTLRTRALGFVLIFIFMHIYLNSNIKVKKMGIVSVSIVSVVFLIFLINLTGSFDKYYGEGVDSARNRLTFDSIRLATESFPIGKGLGTFGTASARTYYSPIYVMNGYSKIYGLGFLSTDYLTDSFWPAILGQYGYLGLIVFIGVILSLLSRAIQLLKLNKAYALSFVTPLIYLLISSTSSNSFFNPMSVGLAIIMAFGVKLGTESKGEFFYNKNTY